MATDRDGHVDRKVQGTWYADSFDVGQSALQFKVDCGHETIGEGGEAVHVYFRLVSSPPSARELFRMLGVALLRYADSFGPIDDSSGSTLSRNDS